MFTLNRRVEVGDGAGMAFLSNQAEQTIIQNVISRCTGLVSRQTIESIFMRGWEIIHSITAPLAGEYRLDGWRVCKYVIAVKNNLVYLFLDAISAATLGLGRSVFVASVSSQSFIPHSGTMLEVWSEHFDTNPRYSGSVL